MKIALIALVTTLLGACSTMTSADNPQGVHGMAVMKSAHNVKTTLDKFEAAVKAKDMRVFARVDHTAGAASIGKTLRPTEVLIWGNPQGGTPLMLCAQTVGIDLPQKALAWQDAKGDVYLGWNDPVHLLATRHANADCAAVTQNVAAAIKAFATQATQ